MKKRLFSISARVSLNPVHQTFLQKKENHITAPLLDIWADAKHSFFFQVFYYYHLLLSLINIKSTFVY